MTLQNTVLGIWQGDANNYHNISGTKPNREGGSKSQSRIHKVNNFSKRNKEKENRFVIMR